MQRSTATPLVLCLLLILCLTVPACSTVYYVKTTGSDTNTGLSWDQAKRTIQAGINAAPNGSEVWVAAGTYVERPSLSKSVTVYGGFPTGGGDSSSRNWTTNQTIIDGSQGGSVISVSGDCRIDGFTVRNGKAGNGGGVCCNSGVVTIANCTITGNSAWGDNTLRQYGYGGGIYCGGSVNLILQNSVISINEAHAWCVQQCYNDPILGYFCVPLWGGGRGGGIACVGSSSSPSVTVMGNTITNNRTFCAADTTTQGGGVWCSNHNSVIAENIIADNVVGDTNASSGTGGGIYFAGSGTLSYNMIARNTSTGKNWSSGGGLYCEGAGIVISHNTVIDNSSGSGGGIACSGNYGGGATVINNIVARNTSGAGAGAGIHCYENPTTVVNNTIVANNGWGISLSKYVQQVYNNLVCFNGFGISRWSPSYTPAVDNNNVYGNTGGDYYDITPGGGSISVDPLLVNRLGGDYHLTSASPCRNTGLNTATGIPTTDVDGQGRIEGGTVDIGADEFWPCVPSIKDAKTGPDLTGADIDQAIISAAWPNFFYIEHDKRINGIRVEKAGHGLSEGMRADVFGITKTNGDGERYIAASTALQSLPPNSTGSVDPIVTGCARVDYSGAGIVLPQGQQPITGSIGLSTIGLLVTNLGKVTPINSSSFYINDGSPANVKVVVPPTVTVLPPANSFVSVTGIASCEKSGDDLVRVLRVREQPDIVKLKDP